MILDLVRLAVTVRQGQQGLGGGEQLTEGSSNSGRNAKECQALSKCQLLDFTKQQENAQSANKQKTRANAYKSKCYSSLSIKTQDPMCYSFYFLTLAKI